MFVLVLSAVVDSIDPTMDSLGYGVRTASHPTSRPPIGCMAVTAALCDQMSAMEPASPLAMQFNAA